MHDFNYLIAVGFAWQVQRVIWIYVYTVDIPITSIYTLTLIVLKTGIHYQISCDNSIWSKSEFNRLV